MIVDAEGIAQDCINIIKEKIEDLNHLNVIIAGKTGVGKSTLINNVFKGDMAEVGIGKPVTEKIRAITLPGVPLTLYDTRGLELGKEVQEQVKNEVVQTIEEGLRSGSIDKMIHCIWYCVNTASGRIEPGEIEWIRQLTESDSARDVPVVVVLTQSFSKKKADEMRRAILDENLRVVQVVPVLAEDYPIDDEYVAKAYGLDVLVKVVARTLPDELQEAFMHVQIANLEEKKRNARIAIAAAASAAIAEGAAPIPLADAALLVPTQVTMIAAITVIYGLDVSKSFIMGIISSTIGSGGATVLGKTVVSNILKLIPGAGSVVGGAISASTAGLITAALGEAYAALLEAVLKGEISRKDLDSPQAVAERMSTAFKQELKHPSSEIVVNS